MQMERADLSDEEEENKSSPCRFNMQMERADLSDEEEENKFSPCSIIFTLLVVLVVFVVTFTVITMLWPTLPLPQAPQPDFLDVSLVRRAKVRGKQPVTPGSVMTEHSLAFRLLIAFLFTLLIVLGVWCSHIGTEICTLLSFICNDVKAEIQEACTHFFSRIYGVIKSEIRTTIFAFITKILCDLKNKILSATSSYILDFYNYLKEAMGSVWRKFSERGFSTCCLAGAFFSCLFVFLISLIMIAVIFHWLQ